MPQQNPDINNHVIAWQVSGLSQAAYCREAGIPYHRLRDGLRRQAKRNDRPTGFVEVMRPAHGSVAILTLPAGLRLEFTDRADSVWVGCVVRSVVVTC